MDWTLAIRGTHTGSGADVEEAAAQAVRALEAVGAHQATLDGSRDDGSHVVFEPEPPEAAEPAGTPDEAEAGTAGQAEA